MRLHRFLCLIFILSLALSSRLFAQETEAPQEPELELPELALSFEADQEEELPLLELDPAEALEPEILEAESGLAEEIPVSETLDLPVPAFDALPYGDAAAPLYGRGLIGFGTANLLIGEVEIATLGADPGFGLSYRHSSLDGFGTHAPGEGFTTRREEIEGRAEYAALPGRISFLGSFIEDERGLQGESSYSSRLNRLSSGRLAYRSESERGWYASGAIDATGGYQNLSGADPQDRSLVQFSPTVEGGYGWERYRLGLSLAYGLQSSAEQTQNQLSAGIRLGAEINPQVGISLQADTLYQLGDEDEGFAFPAELRLNLGLNDTMSLEASGGYIYRPADPLLLFESAPFLRLPEYGFGFDEGWTGELVLRNRLASGLYLNLSGEWLHTEFIRPGEEPEGVSPLLPALSEEIREVLGRAELDFPLSRSLFGSFSAELGYDYQETDLSVMALALNLERDRSAAKLGFSLSGEWDLKDDEETPIISGEAWYEALGGVRLILDVEDILGPLNSGGREDQSGLELPGLLVSAGVEISL